MNCRIYTGFLLLVLLACGVRAQDTRYIDLKALQPPQRLQHYRIVALTDDRPDTTSLGTLQLGFLNRKTNVVQLKGGAVASFNTFIAASFTQDTAATPVQVHIKALNIKEVTAGLRSEIAIKLTAVFYLNGQRLTEYTANANVKTMGDQLAQVKELLAQNLQTSLVAFDEWWLKYRNLYLQDAPVPVEVVINTTSDTSRLINYSSRRPLMISDFVARPDPADKAVAITASYMMIKYSLIEDTDHLKMMVTITPYFDKSRSWFRRTPFDDQVLLHEQGHFDITAIKTCELADTLRHCTFTKANCYDMVEKIQLQKQEELRILQAQYDDKTSHGAGIEIQLKWSKLLKEMLAQQTCFP